MDVIDLIGKIPEESIMYGEKSHKYLQEMYRECFEGREAFTVGETSFATPVSAPLYSDKERKELTMVFGFEHLGLEEVKGNGKWDLKPLDVNELKQVFLVWQKALHEKGWNSLFWSNHDQPRIVSRMGNDTVYRKESAKMLGMILHGMQGTPYIYQGEEIGMTNVKFALEEYKDVETINMVKEKQEAGWSMEKIMKGIYAKGRDNARTPIQWNEGDNAGFSDHEPWIGVNPNYKEINVEEALKDENSVFHFYQKLIRLRKEYEIISTGDFELFFEEDRRFFAYKRQAEDRTLVVLANFTGDSVACDCTEAVSYTHLNRKNAERYPWDPYWRCLYGYENTLGRRNLCSGRLSDRLCLPGFSGYTGKKREQSKNKDKLQAWLCAGKDKDTEAGGQAAYVLVSDIRRQL